MRLGFYYHIPILQKGNDLFLPGYLAVFVEALAREVETLVLFLHQAPKESTEADTPLTATNMQWVNLGTKTPAWHRSLFHKKVLRPVAENSSLIDLLLVRSPSPLAPYFHKIFPPKKIAYLVVGDYNEGAQYMKVESIRDWLVKKYTIRNHRVFMRALKNTFVIVNSGLLFNSLKVITDNIHLIKTTTLSTTDFFDRIDSFNEPLSQNINILFTGRIVPEKGLELIVDASKMLIQQGLQVKFHVAGITVKGREDYVEQLKTLCQIGSENFFEYHGLKKVGIDLNKLYRAAQIYVLASTSDFEGFPRTIWEAMANACPVIATKVGGIPNYLEHEKHALLIEPRNANAIAEAIIRIINDEPLRKKLIKNGLELAKENTLEIQTKKLVQILEKSLQNA